MAEIIGTVSLMHSNQLPGREDEPKVCICCPGFASHIFGINFDLPEYPTDDPKHFGRNLDRWLQSSFPLKQMEGRRIRITAEIIEDDTTTTAD
jgi:hypothetical protein